VLERLEPRAARADARRRARWSERTLNAFDGVFSGAAALDNLASYLADSVLSATGLEGYATCPYSYLLGNILRVKPLEEPEALLRLEPMTRGKIVHRILQRFVAALGAPPALADVESHREALRAILDQELSRAQAQGLTGSPLFWAADRTEIVDDLLAWLDQELGTSTGFTTSAVEVAFGPTWSDGPRSPLASDEPLVLEVAGRKARLHGFIDRIDYTPGGAYRVLDYKTGRGSGLQRAGKLNGGRALQLPIYLLAGAMLLDIDPASGEAAYQLVQRRGGLKRFTFTGAQFEARREEIEAVLGRIVDGIATGDFHAEPSDDTCRYCDFRSVCDVGRQQIRKRKRDDPNVVSFGQMREIA
jgi:ATP-dependent helicase/DNAse subunit B